MRETDVAIIGAGLAGSVAAAMLGRAGIDAAIVDPRSVYPLDFRCEKLDGVQVAILRKTGLADDVLQAATHDRECWIARFGRLIDQRPGDQHGILYSTLVNTVRGLIPPRVPMIEAKATAVETGNDRQTVTLSSGDKISARLIVMANGLNIGLRHSLGLAREVLSECHSISIGFNIKPIGRSVFDFPALTYYPEHISDRTAVLTLFPIGTMMRANLFIYRGMQDPWLRTMRENPVATLNALMPGLQKITGSFEVPGIVQIRPVDLYATRGFRQPGLVLIGDAFATSCPAAGTGARKALNDVERLCNFHVPRWLTTPGMGVDKVANFYDDPVKRACDNASLAKAYDLRSLSLDDGLLWRARRRFKFLGQYAVGTLRQLGSQTALEPQEHQTTPAAGHVGTSPNTI
jgi:2-polyprenyl-6-methoxyphenol hydroxylase-like FAD-dependent oxidoreductase